MMVFEICITNPGLPDFQQLQFIGNSLIKSLFSSEPFLRNLQPPIAGFTSQDCLYFTRPKPAATAVMPGKYPSFSSVAL